MSCSSAGAPESFSNCMHEMPTEITATDARTRSRSGASGPASRSRRVSNWVDTSRVTSGLYMVVLGLGMGFLMQMTTLIAQNSVQPRDIGVASSSRLFFQQIGGSIGVSAFGAIFARRLTDALTSVSPGVHVSTSGGQFNPATVRGLPAAIQHDVYYAISHAIHGVFLWAIPASALAFVLAWFIKEVPLRGRLTPGDAETAAPELVA
jgi:hypothetical protein